MFAVIESGGKQYRVQPGDELIIEKIDVSPGEKISFDRVFCIKKEGVVKIGTPLVKNAQVKAEVLAQGRDKKVTIFKYKPKKRYRVKRGHRQPFTKVKILDITSGS